jgi:hypothetical protein
MVEGRMERGRVLHRLIQQIARRSITAAATLCFHANEKGWPSPLVQVMVRAMP